MLRAVIVGIAASLLALPGCRCAETPPGAERPAASSPDLSLSGRILHEGIVPPAPAGPASCSPRAPLRRGPEDGLADVMVHLREAPSPAPGSLELSGDGCVFEPRAAIVPVGTELVVANDGPGLQTFHLRRLDGSQELAVQNLALPPGAALLRYVLDRPGRYRLAADSKPWMASYLWVVEGGAGAITDEDGRFEHDLPPGDWMAELWHPLMGRRLEAVGVPVDGPGSLYLTWSEPSEDAGSR